MSVINPDLIFGNALNYTADDIVLKANFPSITKKMVDKLNQLVLVRETFTPDGSAFGTLYYTGSIVGFTYEQIVNIEKVEDITLLADEVSQGVTRIKNLITQSPQNDTELSSSLPTLKEKLKANNSSSIIDNISTDINTLNDSLKQFNSFLGTYTSEAQQFLDIINKVNQIASSSLGGTLRQGVYNITYQSNPYKVTTNTTLNTNPIFLSGNNEPTSSIQQQTEPIIQQLNEPSIPLITYPRYILDIKIEEGDNPEKVKELENLEKSFLSEKSKIFESYFFDKKVGKVVDNPKTTKDELKEEYDKIIASITKKKDDKIKEIEKKYSTPQTPPKPTTTTPTPPKPNNSPTPPGGEQGIKDFQDWLDKKGYKWTSKKGQLNKGSGYGKSGPSTEAAWKTYGNDFLKEKSPTTPTPTLTPEEQAIINDLTPVPTLSFNSNFGNISNPTLLPSSGNSSSPNQTNYSDEYIISVYKLTSNKNVQTTIASSTLSPTTIVFSRNKNQLNTNTPNQGYDNTKDITNLKDFISQNKIKNITCVNLWSFPKESIPTVALKGKVISSKTGEGLGNAKVKFKPLISAETRARLEQFINNSGVGSVITQGQQSINDIVTSYNSVTGSIQSFTPQPKTTGSFN